MKPVAPKSTVMQTIVTPEPVQKSEPSQRTFDIQNDDLVKRIQ
jgi:hypothetical protein